MLCNKNENLESRNFVDDVNFTKNDPCLFVTYPGGAAGDLLIAIIDKHYLRTGCEYYGIGDNGRVHMFTTDYESLDKNHNYDFSDQWFFDLYEQLGSRNLNYSLLDQVIFGCHMYTPNHIEKILDTFPHAKVINIFPKDNTGRKIIRFLVRSKLKNKIHNLDDIRIPESMNYKLVNHERVLNLPFGFMFNEESYNKNYKKILEFLDLKGRLINFDFVEFYISKQHSSVQQLLKDYSKTLA